MVREILQGFEGIFVRDGWHLYMVVTTASHQLDLLHITPWLQRA